MVLHLLAYNRANLANVVDADHASLLRASDPHLEDSQPRVRPTTMILEYRPSLREVFNACYHTHASVHLRDISITSGYAGDTVLFAFVGGSGLGLL